MKPFKPLLAMLLILFLVIGCASSSPRYGDEGIYGSSDFEGAQVFPAQSAYSANYPYWSLDHFYFSRFYSPYSVVVNPWDPWLFPYSGWYWNYPFSHGRFFAGSPWHYWGPWSIHHQHNWHHPRYRDYGLTNDYYRNNAYNRRLGANSGPIRPTAGHQDHRIRQFEQRRYRSNGGDSGSTVRRVPDARTNSRSVPRPQRRAPTNRRTPARASQPVRSAPRRAPARPARVREQPPSF